MNARQFFVEDPATGEIRFTRTGLEQFRERFARIGIDIRRIRTRAAFQDVYEKCWNAEMELTTLRTSDPLLDAILLEIPAVREGMKRRTRRD